MLGELLAARNPPFRANGAIRYRYCALHDLPATSTDEWRSAMRRRDSGATSKAASPRVQIGHAKRGNNGMDVTALAIPDVKLIKPKIFRDERGFFSETYNKRALEEVGIAVEFVQDNHSLSRERGVIRGLHFQIPPRTQDKLLRVIRGSIFDVAVDIRRSSST